MSQLIRQICTQRTLAHKPFWLSNLTSRFSTLYVRSDDYQSENRSSYGRSKFNDQRRNDRFNDQGGRNNFRSQNNRFYDDQHLNVVDWSKEKLVPIQKNNYQPSETAITRSKDEVKAFHQQYDIKIRGKDSNHTIFEFNEVGFPSYITDQLAQKNFKQPTVIQSMSWPIVMAGRDLVGIAQTGSGKTLGYILPALVHILNQDKLQSQPKDGPIALVLAPTRELAQQIKTVASEFGKQIGIRNTCLFGGASKGPQLHELMRGPEIVIATPGRLIDFLQQETINLKRCSYLVLDEADRMLDMGFEPQIRKIIEQIRPDRQVLMWSATWPKEVKSLAEDFLNDHVQVNIGSMNLSANQNILQIVEVCKDWEKDTKLVKLLTEFQNDKNGKTLIFAETKRSVDDIKYFLMKNNFRALAIHGDKSQRERDFVLQKFRQDRQSILIATSVAARGLDVDDVKFVVNYDFPSNTEDYVHRIGRTGRSNNKGTSYTFFTETHAARVDELINILKESNQYVGPELMQFKKASRGSNTQQYGSFKNNNFGRSGNLKNTNFNKNYSFGNRRSGGRNKGLEYDD